MSKTWTALLVKFVMTLIFAAATLAFIRGNSWGWVFVVAVVATILNYLVGDLLILPAFGNITAAISDGIIGALSAYVIDLLVPAFRTTTAALLIFAILIAVGEYFFHQYLLRSEKVES
ncbi:MAG: YndM family protein [Firmicutes bacterium]|nr:YndM family protein [Bacillota bacterium]